MRNFVLILLLAITFSWAKQTAHKVTKNTETWSYTISWKDGSITKHKARFDLDAAATKKQMQMSTHLNLKKMYQYQAQEINKWAKKNKSMKVKAQAQSNGVSISAGSSAGKKQAMKVAERAQKDYMKTREYTMYDGGAIPDHILHVKKYGPTLAPIVKALGGPTKDPHEFANKALSFVQTIPYSNSREYQRPAAVITRNMGDCDSKTVVFLSLMKQAYPDLPVAVVLVKGHAFGAIAIKPKKGDRTFKAEGKEWVAVEPVGPQIQPAGSIGSTSSRKLRFGAYEIRTLN